MLVRKGKEIMSLDGSRKTDELTNQEKISAVDFWQDEVPFHDLTCGNDSGHLELRGKEKSGGVFMFCPTCDYEQDWIPDCVFRAYVDREMIRGWGISF